MIICYFQTNFKTFFEKKLFLLLCKKMGGKLILLLEFTGNEIGRFSTESEKNCINLYMVIWLTLIKQASKIVMVWGCLSA